MDIKKADTDFSVSVLVERQINLSNQFIEDFVKVVEFKQKSGHRIWTSSTKSPCQSEIFIYLCIVVWIRKATNKSRHPFPKRGVCFLLSSSTEGVPQQGRLFSRLSKSNSHKWEQANILWWSPLKWRLSELSKYGPIGEYVSARLRECAAITGVIRVMSVISRRLKP